jgi:NAD+ diphosphatase
VGKSLPDLALAASPLDRRADLRLDEELLVRLLADPATRVLELRGDRVAVEEGDGGCALVLRAPQPADVHRLGLYLGQGGDGTAYVGVVGDRADEAPGLRTLRQVGADLDDLDGHLVATGLALANWHAAHGFCPRCGAPTVPVQAGWLRRCTRDDSEHYPRTDVAVIMSVVDDEDRLLLARGAGWGPGRFSVLAGFLEPGESLAAAVAREVREEVGLEVRDVEYLGDQPWPFPNSLMVGFSARTTGGELVPQDGEIAEARWFSRDELRAAVDDGTLAVSSRLSISRRLLEHWLGHALPAR